MAFFSKDSASNPRNLFSSDKLGGNYIHDLNLSRGGETTHACMPGCLIQCSNVYADKDGNEIWFADKYNFDHTFRDFQISQSDYLVGNACSHAWFLRAVLGGNTFYGRVGCTQHGGRDNPFTDGYTAFARMLFGAPAFFWDHWCLIFWSEIRRGLHS